MIATVSTVLNFTDSEKNAYVVMKKIEYIISYKKVTCDFYGIVRSINIDKWLLNAIVDPTQRLKVVKRLKEKSKQLLKIWQHRKEVGDGRWEFED